MVLPSRRRTKSNGSHRHKFTKLQTEATAGKSNVPVVAFLFRFIAEELNAFLAFIAGEMCHNC